VLICDKIPVKLANVKKELTLQPEDMVSRVFVSELYDRQKSFGTERYSQMQEEIRPSRYCECTKGEGAKG
jgi:hypothetical protein